MDEAFREAEKRLTANSAERIAWEDIVALRHEFGLSEQVELGMKLLDPKKVLPTSIAV